MSFHKSIPNILTMLRLGAALLLNGIMINGADYQGSGQVIPVLIALTAFIYLSDYFDGKLARHWECCSAFGAKADIAADIIYIFSQDAVLTGNGQMNGWIFVLVLMEFGIFIVSSVKQSKETGVEKIWFDQIGRMAAVYFYAMPLEYTLIAQLSEYKIHDFLFISANLLCLLLVIAAIGSRIAMKKRN